MVYRSFGHFAHEFGIFMDFSSLGCSHDIRTDLAGTDSVAADETLNGKDFLFGTWSVVHIIIYGCICRDLLTGGGPTADDEHD